MAVAGFAVLLIRNRPLPAAHERAFVRPTHDRLATMEVCWVEFDRGIAPAMASTAGFTHAHTWELTASGLLIRHPKGTLLVDAGSSTHFQQEIADYPFWSHLHFEILTGGKSAASSASAVLLHAGVRPETLTGVVLSHAHMDHAGGLIDLPGIPVILSQAELDFIARYRDAKTIRIVPAHARAIEGRAHVLHFEDKPYEIFDQSADLFGDGSVVLVQLPGHTPGSIGVFVSVTPALRIFHVGDAVNVNEVIERRLPKSFLMATTDNDHAEANATVAKLAQLHALDPDLLNLPAHDRAAWKKVFGSSPGCRR